MDRAEERPPLSLLGGSQLRLGLMEEGKKETLFEDLRAFTGLFPIYLFRRVRSVLAVLFRAVFSGFVLTEQLKSWLARLFIRRKGQLSFPVAHATLVGVSLTVLVTTAVLGGVIFKKPKATASINPFILESSAELNTEESQLTKVESFQYSVEEDEDLSTIAAKFTRTPDDIASANNLKNGKDGSYDISLVKVLTIPPLEGFSYTAKSGDTVESLARRYSTDPQSVIEINYLFGSYRAALPAGKKLFIPTPTGAQLADSSLKTALGSCGPLEDFGWPTKSKVKIGDYTYSHRGVDFAANFEPLYAPADGTVVAAGGNSAPCFSFGPKCNYGYGGFVFIDLGDGYQVRYGHVSQWPIPAGKNVSKGDVVAISGESGVAYGPHLHFELLCNGQKISPYSFWK
jgi:LysM repeat protein